jgi:RNA polymerase sigma-54 factor
MPLAMQQVQRLQQRLIMTPQMQQSVKLLQMNTLELEALTQQELLENPFLEIEEDALDPSAGNPETPSASTGEDGPSETAEVVHERDADPESDGFELTDTYDTAPDTQSIRAEEAEGSPSLEAGGADLGEPPISSLQSETSGEEPPRSQEVEDDLVAGLDTCAVEDQPEQFGEVDTDWAEVFQDDDVRTYSQPREDADERSFEEIVSSRASLYEELEWQLRVSALRDLDEKIGAYLIGCIDDDGYLQTSLEECAAKFGVELARVEHVLSVIQDFDPNGVGARDLPECLRLQLKALGDLTPLAEEVLRDHWPLLARKKFKEITRLVKATEPEIQALFERVQKLQPAPGRIYSKEQPLYITPDVYVKRIGNQYVTYLNEGRVAHLHLNSAYKDMLIRGDDPSQDPKAREYALEKYRSAVMFIKNVEKRRNTVLRVTEAIMEYQREFLEKGVEALRPLALSEIATRVGMHESTISRVTSNKYVDTPRGLFELKFFFSSAIESRHGEAASSRSIKQKIQELIAAENPKRPLSDDKIAQALKAEGFSIARRTIAKYREQLKILPTNLRKQNK